MAARISLSLPSRLRGTSSLFFSTATRSLASQANSLTQGGLSIDPTFRLQQKAARTKDRDNLALSIHAAKRIINDSVILFGDTETSGIYPDKYGPHRIVSLALSAYRNRRPELSAEFIINPQRPCNVDASEVHGLSDEFLATAHKFKEVAPAVFNIMNAYPDSILLFHNAPFDWRMINNEIQQCPTSMAPILRSHNPVFCTLQIARQIRAMSKSCTLDTLCDVYGIDRSSRANGHGALIDTELLAQMSYKLSEDLLDKSLKAGVLEAMEAHAEALLSDPKPAFKMRI